MIREDRIWTPYQVFYIQGMLFNYESALRSITSLDRIFDGLPEEVTEEDIQSLPTHFILNQLQNIVTQGAAISRFFWPVRKTHEARGRHLQEAFGVDESSPLFARGLRNAIEHFDERLDKYLGSGIAGYVFPEFVGPRPPEDDVPGHFFRAFFLDCGIFRLLDGDYEIQPLVAEIVRVGRLLEHADRNGGVFPRT